MSTTGTVRPTKKQQELLKYIGDFIQQHGYSPSYREIMNGLSYNSVATVALHVTNLIRRGHLIKRDRSARSLELARVVMSETDQALPEQWLLDQVAAYFAAEPAADRAELAVLVEALEILGLSAASDYRDKLSSLDS